MVVAFLELDDERQRLRTAVAMWGLVVLQPHGMATDVAEHSPFRLAASLAPLLRGLQIVVGVDLLESDRAGFVEQRHAVAVRNGTGGEVGRKDVRSIAAGARIPLVAQTRVVLTHEDREQAGVGLAVGLPPPREDRCDLAVFDAVVAALPGTRLKSQVPARAIDRTREADVSLIRCPGSAVDNVRRSAIDGGPP
jgi:hypothetical protein